MNLDWPMFLDTQDHHQTPKWDQGQPVQNPLPAATIVKWVCLEVQVVTHTVKMLTWKLHVTFKQLICNT